MVCKADSLIQYPLFDVLTDDQWVVEQWTGLSDKNGIEIFEGDVLSYYEGEEILLVQYCKEYARFGCLIYLQYGVEPENDCWRWLDELIDSNSEVVGNQHQNIELLTAKKE